MTRLCPSRLASQPLSQVDGARHGPELPRAAVQRIGNGGIRKTGTDYPVRVGALTCSAHPLLSVQVAARCVRALQDNAPTAEESAEKPDWNH